MKAGDLMAKAEQASISARVLLDRGDSDGACNRAYYAMFDAARAVLLLYGHEFGKTHRGLVSAFSQHLVRNDPLPREGGVA